MKQLDKRKEDLVELFSKEQIQCRIEQVACQINQDFSQGESICVICVLKGAVLFACDLIKPIDYVTHFEFIILRATVITYSSVKLNQSHWFAGLEGTNVLLSMDMLIRSTACFLINYIK
jgi:hypoxanthine phosphoribosyltransferase